MFYDGAYTEQTDMQPAGTNGATQPSVLDGAKRDRAIWSGDLGIEGQGIADTLGTNGNDYVKQSLLTLITSSPQGGGLNADTLFRTGPYSNSYSSWTLDAATEYYRNTGDTAFAQQILPWLEGQLAYDATLTDVNGLIVTGASISTTNGGYDWDFYDGAKTGVVTAYNALYYRALQDVAYIEAEPGQHGEGRRVRPDRRPGAGRHQRQPAQPVDRHLLPERVRPRHARAGRERPRRPVRHRPRDRRPPDPELAEEPVGAARVRTVLRNHLQQPHQPVHHRLRGGGGLPGRRHRPTRNGC